VRGPRRRKLLFSNLRLISGERLGTVAPPQVLTIAERSFRRPTIMTFKLPPLPYAYDALGPQMSAETLQYHHDKHHQAYVDMANKLVPGTKYEGKKPMPTRTSRSSTTSASTSITPISGNG
jgi:hypothetical protein